MPYIDTEKLIKQYWKTVKDKYPNISFLQFEKICKAPFWYFKSQMEKEETPIIHIKYFGKFVVFSQNIRKRIKENDVRLKKGKITQEVWKERDDNLQRKLKEVIDSNNKNKETD